MSISPNQFKKKRTNFDFSDNAMMTSSVRVSAQTNSDEVCLSMEKELKKTKTKFNDLTEKYQKMKNYNIFERVELQMNLEDANAKIQHMTEQRGMLMNRIKHLEKEAQSVKKSYERPLNRSINKSVIRSSHIQSQNILSASSMNLKTERSQNSQNSLQDLDKTRKNFHDEDFTNDSQYYEGDTVEKITFDKRQQNKKPLICEENQNEEQCYCGNKRCVQNYQQLQGFKEQLDSLTDRMEKVCIQIEFEVERRLNYQNLAEFKLKIQQVSKQNPGLDFSTKGKPDYLIGRIQEKMKDFINGPTYKAINPLIDMVKQKLKDMQREEEAFREEMACQSYDYEFQQKEIEKIARNQRKAFKKAQEMMIKSGNINPSMDKFFKNYQESRQRQWKKIGLAQ